MRLLLINSNPAVSRLINLSAKKFGYEIEEFKGDDFDLNESFDITIADNEAVSDNSMLLLRESGNLGDIIYIGPKGLPKPVYANYFLQKPFLPTDFIDMIKKIENSKKQETKTTNEQDEDLTFVDEDNHDEIDNSEENFNMEALDLDELDSLDLPMPEDEFKDFAQELSQESEENEESDIKNQDENQEEILEENSLDGFEEPDVVDNESLDANSENEDKNVDDTMEESEDNEEIDEELEVPQELKLEVEPTEDENGSSILDSEEIDEVKHLLDEDEPDEVEEVDDEDEKLDEEEDVLEEEKLLEESNIEEAIDDLSDDEGVFEDMLSQNEELDTPQEILEEIQSLQEGDEQSESEDIGEEQSKVKDIGEEMELVSKEEKSSIDDLSEDDLKGLFSSESTDEDLEKDVDVSELREELQTKITKDVKKVLEKDEIREALKGLKVNISISFDEE